MSTSFGMSPMVAICSGGIASRLRKHVYHLTLIRVGMSDIQVIRLRSLSGNACAAPCLHLLSQRATAGRLSLTPTIFTTCSRWASKSETTVGGNFTVHCSLATCGALESRTYQSVSEYSQTSRPCSPMNRITSAATSEDHKWLAITL